MKTLNLIKFILVACFLLGPLLASAVTINELHGSWRSDDQDGQGFTTITYDMNNTFTAVSYLNNWAFTQYKGTWDLSGNVICENNKEIIYRLYEGDDWKQRTDGLGRECGIITSISENEFQTNFDGYIQIYYRVN